MGQVQGLGQHLHQGKPQKYKTQRHYGLIHLNVCVCVFFSICFGFVFCVCFYLFIALCRSSPCVVVTCSSPCITTILGSFLTSHYYCSPQLLLLALAIIVHCLAWLLLFASCLSYCSSLCLLLLVVHFGCLCLLWLLLLVVCLGYCYLLFTLCCCSLLALRCYCSLPALCCCYSLLTLHCCCSTLGIHLTLLCVVVIHSSP